MRDEIRLRYQLRSRDSEYQNLVRTTKAEIRRILDMYENPYLSYSGGKDSSVMLHLITEYRPDIWVFHWDYGPWLMPRWLEKEILSNLQILAPKCRSVYVERPGGDSESARHSNIHESKFFEIIRGLVVQYQWDIGVVGIRTLESRKRRHRARNATEYSREMKCHHYYPMRNWSANDIWTYIVEHKLPYPSVYDQLGDKVAPWEYVRMSTFFDHETYTNTWSGMYLWKDRDV